MDDLKHLCHQQSPGIIALCETCLDEGVLPCEVCLPNYQLFQQDRDRHSGGVALYISDTLAVRKVTPSNSYELLSAELSRKSGLILVAIVYRPPGSDNDLVSLLLALGSLNLPKYNSVIILGDFNIDLTTPYSSSARDFISLMDGFGLHQLVDSPTRTAGSSSTILDLVFCNNPSLISAVRVSYDL